MQWSKQLGSCPQSHGRDIMSSVDTYRSMSLKPWDVTLFWTNLLHYSCFMLFLDRVFLLRGSVNKWGFQESTASPKDTTRIFPAMLRRWLGISMLMHPFMENVSRNLHVKGLVMIGSFGPSQLAMFDHTEG